MANEIQLSLGRSGAALYGVIRDAGGRVWNAAAFVAYNEPDWETYAVTLTEQGASGYYLGDFPGVAAGVYLVEAREQAGVAADPADVLVGSGSVDWSGTTLAHPLALVDVVVDNGVTVRHLLQLIGAVLGGKTVGGGGATEIFKAIGGDQVRITATYDQRNRATITLTFT